MGFFKKDLGLASPLDVLVDSYGRDPKNPFQVIDEGEFVEVESLEQLTKIMAEKQDGSTDDTGDLSG